MGRPWITLAVDVLTRMVTGFYLGLEAPSRVSIGQIPRKGGPGVTRSDLLVINKIDLAPYVGASLEVMARDAALMPQEPPFRHGQHEDRRGGRSGHRLPSATRAGWRPAHDSGGAMRRSRRRGRRAGLNWPRPETRKPLPSRFDPSLGFGRSPREWLHSERDGLTCEFRPLSAPWPSAPPRPGRRFPRFTRRRARRRMRRRPVDAAAKAAKSAAMLPAGRCEE